jgi:hypothetical protein
LAAELQKLSRESAGRLTELEKCGLISKVRGITLAEATMLKRPIFDHAVFDYDLTELMGEAFDATHAVLANVSPPLAVLEGIAHRIMEAVLHGERDLMRLREAALGLPKITPE